MRDHRSSPRRALVGTRPATRPATRLATRLATVLVTVLATSLAGLLLLAAPAPAVACSCADANVADSAEKADVVISGTVRRAERDRTREGRPNRDELTLTVDVDRVYKGTITRDAVTVTSPANPSTCGLGVVGEQERWVFFARAQGSQLSTNVCTGTRRATGGYTEQVRAALGEGTRTADSSSPTSAPPERTTLDDSAPPDFGRAAAPGAALAIVGLLGLLVVRRRARRD